MITRPVRFGLYALGIAINCLQRNDTAYTFFYDLSLMAKPSVLIAFTAYIILNVISCFLIPFIIDYLHNVINGVFIPQSFFFENGIPRQGARPRILAQTTFILVEWIGLLFGLYRLNQWLCKLWSPTQGAQIALWTSIAIAVITAIRLSMMFAFMFKRW